MYILENIFYIQFDDSKLDHLTYTYHYNLQKPLCSKIQLGFS